MLRFLPVLFGALAPSSADLGPEAPMEVEEVFARPHLVRVTGGRGGGGTGGGGPASQAKRRRQWRRSPALRAIHGAGRR